MEKSLLCRSVFNDNKLLKLHYQNFHNVDSDNYFCKKTIQHRTKLFYSKKVASLQSIYETQKHLPNRSTYNKTNKIKHSSAWQCHYCSNYYGRKDKYEKHLEYCSTISGIVYKFDTQNVVTSEDNLKYKGDLLFVAYFDFEGIAPMLAVSYVIVFAFHTELSLDSINIENRLVIVQKH